MLGSLALAAAAAIVCYTLLPALSGAWFLARRRRILALLRTATPGYCAGVGPEGIRFEPMPPAAPVPAGGAPQAEQKAIPIERSVFFVFSKDTVRETRGKDLRLIAVNAPLLLSNETLPFKRRVVAVFDPSVPAGAAKNPAGFLDSRPAQGPAPDPFRYLWAALGVFIEFLFFITWLGAYETPLPAIAALVAIFGKALPWCPPGLAFTLLAHYLTAKPQPDKKKGRRLKAVGLLLVALGVSVNLAAIFLGIRQTGWIPF